MIRIWGRRSAYNVQKVLWTLGELGLPYEHIDVGGAAGGLDTPQFRAMNPNGRIPVLADDGVFHWESNTIVRYLAATYGRSALWSESPATRSVAERWMDWELATLQPAFLSLFWSFFRTPEQKRNRQEIEDARKRCESAFGILDAHLSARPFLAGETFTMGDIPAATSLYRYFEMGIAVAELPQVRAWYTRLAKRPAYREHVLVPFEALRGRMTF